MGITFLHHGIKQPAPAGGAFDAATTAWVAAVVANGGTVSAGRETIVDNLIVGLKADGLFTKLDRLWLFAAENQPSALTDIIADQLATAVNSPTFTTDRGYTGNASSMYINSNFNPTSGTPNYTQDSACLFAWNNTPGSSSSPWLAGSDGAGGTGISQLTIYYTDTNNYWSITETNTNTTAGTGDTGLYLVNRTDSTHATLDVNGSQSDAPGTASSAVNNSNLVALRIQGSFYTDRQCSCLGFGASLGTSTDRTNLYNRLRTYMTAVGVP